MLVGKNLALRSVDDIIERFINQEYSAASLLAKDNVHSINKEELKATFSSYINSDTHWNYGFHLSLTPDEREVMYSDDAVSICVDVLTAYDCLQKPWLIIKEDTIIPHYHIVSIISYGEKENKHWLVPVSGIIESHGYEYRAATQLAYSQHGRQCRYDHYQINLKDLKESFKRALSYDYYNQRQFASVMSMMGLRVHSRANKLLFSAPSWTDVRASYRGDDGKMYQEMNTNMRLKHRPYYHSAISKLENLVEEAFFLGDASAIFLHDCGIVVDLRDTTNPIYIDVRKKRVYEHREFNGSFSLDLYLKIVKNSDWFAIEISPFNMNYPPIRIARKSDNKRFRKDKCTALKKGDS